MDTDDFSFWDSSGLAGLFGSSDPTTLPATPAAATATAPANTSGGFFSGLSSLFASAAPLAGQILTATNQPKTTTTTKTATTAQQQSSLVKMLLIGGAALLGVVLLFAFMGRRK